MDTSYESAVQREMLKQARRCAQLEMALEAIRAKLSAMAPRPSDGDELRDLITRIDLALETRT